MARGWAASIYRSLNESRLAALAGVDFECPPSCPRGHHCPEATAKPLACNQGQYQDEMGQTGAVYGSD